MIPVDVISGWASVNISNVCSRCLIKTELVDSMSELYFCPSCLKTSKFEKIGVKDIGKHHSIPTSVVYSGRSHIRIIMSMIEIERFDAARLIQQYYIERSIQYRTYLFDCNYKKYSNQTGWYRALSLWAKCVMLMTF